MKDHNRGQLLKNNQLLAEMGIVNTPLKRKYTTHAKVKFGGKKRTKSNEGRTGRVARAKLRALVVGSKSSPDQYLQWTRAMSYKPEIAEAAE